MNKPGSGGQGYPVFQSSRPLRGATAKMHKNRVCFCNNRQKTNAFSPVKRRLPGRWIREPEKTATKPGANRPENTVRSLFALQDHRLLWKVCLFAAKVFDLTLILFPEIIKPKAILFFIHDLAQRVLQASALSRVQQTLKNGILHPLAVVNALLGNLPQTPAPGGITAFTLLALMTSFTSLRRMFVKRMGLHTWMRSITHLRPGCQ